MNPEDLLLEARSASATIQYRVPNPPANKASARQHSKKVKKITDLWRNETIALLHCHMGLQS